MVSGNSSLQSSQKLLSVNLDTLGLQHLRVREYPSTRVRILRDGEISPEKLEVGEDEPGWRVADFGNAGTQNK